MADPLEVIIVELEWDMASADKYITEAWGRVVQAQKYVDREQDSLKQALARYSEAVARKEGIRQALTVLRNHDDS